MVIERLGFNKILSKLPAAAGHIYVLFFALIGWVFFRSPDLAYACTYIKNMFCGSGIPLSNLVDSVKFMTFSNLIIMMIGIVLAYPVSKLIFNKCSVYAKLAIASVLFAISYVFAMTSLYSPFIYFRF